MSEWSGTPDAKELCGKPLTADAIFNDPPEAIPWAVEGLVVESGFTAISGRGGIGKSYILIELAISLATGTPLFNFFAVDRPYRVLYIDMEMLAGATKLRFRRMMRGKFNKIHPLLQANLFVMGQGALDIEKIKTMTALQNFIRDNKIDFVLIDSYRQIFNGDEKDSQFTVRVFKALSKIRNAHSCGFVCIDHVRKPQQPKPGEPEAKKPVEDVDAEVTGSANKLNNLDNNIAVRKGSSPDTIHVIPGKDRHGEGSRSKVDPFDITFDHDDKDDPTGPFRLIYKATANTSDEKAMMDCLKKRQSQSAPSKEVQLELGVSSKAVQRTAASLEQRKLLKRHKVDGVWTISIQVDSESSGQTAPVQLQDEAIS